MAGRKRATSKQSEELDDQRRVKRQENQSVFKQSQTWDDDQLSMMGTKYRPQIEEQAAVLSRMPSSVQRYNSIMQLQQTYGNRYVQHIIKSMEVQASLAVSQTDDITNSTGNFIQTQTPEKKEGSKTQSNEHKPTLVPSDSGEIVKEESGIKEAAEEVRIPEAVISKAEIRLNQHSERGGIEVPEYAIGAASPPDVTVPDLIIFPEPLSQLPGQLTKYDIFMTIEIGYHWDINGRGRKNISSAYDSFVTAETWSKIVDDLMPKGTPPVPPSEEYWCQELVEQHEQFHVNDLTESFARHIEEHKRWLLRQEISNEATVRTRCTEMVLRFKERVESELGRPGVLSSPCETRAYNAMEPEYYVLAEAVKDRAKKEGWSRPPQ
jgi:hypothetical protein